MGARETQSRGTTSDSPPDGIMTTWKKSFSTGKHHAIALANYALCFKRFYFGILDRALNAERSTTVIPRMVLKRRRPSHENQLARRIVGPTDKHTATRSVKKSTADFHNTIPVTRRPASASVSSTDGTSRIENGFGNERQNGPDADILPRRDHHHWRDV